MAAYHQMGHDSWNLVNEEALSSFAGLVLSPVNSTPDQVIEKLHDLGEARERLDIVLDPQLYKPRSDRGKLPDWSYVERDFDTVDLSNSAWWDERCRLLVAESQRVGADAIASPALIPRAFDAAYYESVINCADRLSAMLAGTATSTLITAIVRLADLAQPGAAERIASILTRSRVDRIYLVFHDDLTPRAQRTDAETLAGAMQLIRTLETAASRVLVAFSGLDMLLWKHAGATDVATGKFFNLRRFVPGRWEDPADGGRQLPYWTDDELITWLREDDVRLLLRRGILDPASAVSNPYSQQILEVLDRRSGEAWVRLGWRQYLYWFSQWEAAIRPNSTDVETVLLKADQRWQAIAAAKVYLFDPAVNNGEWVRAWLNALLL
jgi:hypothetical protein